MTDGKQVKNKANPTGTGKFLNESGQYETPPGAGGGLSYLKVRRLRTILNN